ncbi:MAG: hypothetical protein ACK5RG_11995 [Cyclobacteriaceae bacterium]|jgi:hypothetical protein|nr:hypothetical protein [Flammeovirgaceae bacterium]
MKKLVSFSIFAVMVLAMMFVSKSARAQRVIINRSTVLMAPVPNATIASTQGYWKWSNRYQKYVWVTKSKVRFRVHRGYRVRI